MGLATWRAVLAEHKRCPFTKHPLGPEQVRLCAGLDCWARCLARSLVACLLPAFRAPLRCACMPLWLCSLRLADACGLHVLRACALPPFYQLTVLTKNNIERYRARILQQ